jgi:hypothetical protein
MNRRPFYTDMGANLELRDSTGGTMNVPRYGVWVWDAHRQRHQVVDTGDDLEALRAKHGAGELVNGPSQFKT